MRIFETGIPLLFEVHKRSFLAACRAALRGGVKLEFTILDPDCRAADQRAEELGSSLDIKALIRDNLRDLHDFHSDLNQRSQLRLEVRVHSISRLVAYYRWDRRALIAFFPIGRSSEFTSQYETSVESSFAQFVEERFREAWEAPNTLTLQQYFAIPVVIMGTDSAPILAEWVTLDDRLYVAHEELTSRALEYGGLDRLQVYLDHVPPWAGPRGLALCGAQSPAHRVFDRKYGRVLRRTVLEAVASEPDEAGPTLLKPRSAG